MTTPDALTHPAPETAPDAARDETADDSSTRLSLAEHLDRDALDGAWWPRSRDLAVELPGLLDGLPPRVGRVVHVVVSPPDWDGLPRRVSRRGGQTKVGSFPRDDTHLVMLSTSTRVLRILVVPADTDAEHAATLMAVASHGGNRETAAALLAHDVDAVAAEVHWHDDGGQYWGAGTAPSSRPTLAGA